MQNTRVSAVICPCCLLKFGSSERVGPEYGVHLPSKITPTIDVIKAPGSSNTRIPINIHKKLVDKRVPEVRRVAFTRGLRCRAIEKERRKDMESNKVFAVLLLENIIFV